MLFGHHTQPDIEALHTRLSGEGADSVNIEVYSHEPSVRSQTLPLPRYVYRGQERAWQAIPSALRQDKLRECDDLLSDYPYGFRSLQPILNGHIYNTMARHPLVVSRLPRPVDDSESLAMPIAQHYGFRTLALDITFDAKAACSFAANSAESDLGIVFRIDTRALTNRTRLGLIDQRLGFSRPFRQKAAVLDLSSVLNPDPTIRQENKTFDCDLNFLGDIVVPLTFRHTKADESYVEYRKGLMIAEPEEVAFVEDILRGMPNRYPTSRYMAGCIGDNLGRVISECPYAIMQNNPRVFSPDEIDSLVLFCKKCLDFRTGQMIYDFVADWPKSSFASPLSSILDKLRFRIATERQAWQGQINYKQDQVVEAWLEHSQIAKFTQFVTTVHTAMENWQRTFGDYFREVEVPPDLLELLRASVKSCVN